MSSHNIPDSLAVRRLRISHFQAAKQAGEKFTALTSYDAMTARLFDAAGVDMLLVGDSVANTMLGHTSTLPVSLETMALFGRAVASVTQRSLVVVDMPFGSYEVSQEQAVANAVTLLKETGAAAVKLEGGADRAETIAAIVRAGIPVVGHIGFTPQAEHALGGYKVQGRGDAAQQLLADAHAVAQAGAFAVVLEMVPAPLAAQVTTEIAIPTIGIGAGSGTDGQILVWTDAFGLNEGRKPSFVREFADLATQLRQGVTAYIDAVRNSSFPAPEESFDAK